MNVKGQLYGFSVAGPNSYGFFLWGYLTEHVYAFSPRMIEDLMAILQAAVTMVSVIMLRHVEEIAMRCTTVCLEMDEGHSEKL
jgi:hypothetical protein